MIYPQKFPHRRNADGTYDSICNRCFATVASGAVETDLIQFEVRHVCEPLNEYRASQGHVANPAISS
jgi:hypothetical protein